MSITISGNVCVKNGIELDYCFEQAIASLLPVCEEVIACDGSSDDGTKDFLDVWAGREPKLKVITYPWPETKGNPDFWVQWLNWARENTHCQYHLQLDADEVLAEWCYPAIAAIKRHQPNPPFSLRMKRWNFWQDAQHVIPTGHCCSDKVIRFAPQWVFMPSDGWNPNGRDIARMKIESNLEIFHYGFLREREAFFRKAKALQGYFFDSYDPRLAKAESFEGNWMTAPGINDFTDKLVPYQGKHPECMKVWLKDRGYSA